MSTLVKRPLAKTDSKNKLSKQVIVSNGGQIGLSESHLADTFRARGYAQLNKHQQVCKSSLIGLTLTMECHTQYFTAHARSVAAGNPQAPIQY